MLNIVQTVLRMSYIQPAFNLFLFIKLGFIWSWNPFLPFCCTLNISLFNPLKLWLSHFFMILRTAGRRSNWCSGESYCTGVHWYSTKWGVWYWLLISRCSRNWDRPSTGSSKVASTRCNSLLSNSYYVVARALPHTDPKGKFQLNPSYIDHDIVKQFSSIKME